MQMSAQDNLSSEQFEDYRLTHTAGEGKNIPDEVSAYAQHGTRVGYLRWYGGVDGEIHDVNVDEKHRNKKLATQLFHFATKKAKETNRKTPTHSPMRSRSGDAWAKSVGGKVPPLHHDGYSYSD